MTLFRFVLVVALALPIYAQQAPSIAAGPQVLEVQGGKIRVVPVATGLFHPWGLAFPDARTMLVTERNGRMRIIRDGVLAPDPVWTSPAPAVQAASPPVAATQADSLHFVAVH